MGFFEGLIRWCVRSTLRVRRRIYCGKVTNAQGQVIWRCDCRHRSMTAAVRCGRREADYLNAHPEEMARLQPLPWWKR